MNTYSPIYKVILVGDSGVGKTCLLSMYVKGIIESTIPTIAVEFCTKEIELNDGTKVKVQLWDTAGQERFKSLAMTYYRKAYGILLLFDVTKRSSFIACKNYLEEVRINSDKDCVVYLIGNKIDLKDEREVTTKQGEDFSKLNHVHKFVEASAKEGINTRNTFVYIAKLLYEEHSKFEEEEQDKDDKFKINDSQGVSIEIPKEKKKKEKEKKKCC